ncbi:MAG TPA: tetrathionate reductase family octaheme c-type cytochrome [Bacteroidales bacterium]|nr:tetrathionate reductase family octaheme c-type cytochrome [Bacteroidales bacterium]HRZ49398.1 tetrathionate reductase family octaheme c-type cytochrome [Bacteroidales bacterium]
MRNLVQLIFLVFVPVLLIGLLIYDIQNLPGYNNLPELQEKYGEKKSDVTDHTRFEELKGPFRDAHAITAACIKCHQERGHQLLKSHHFTWEKEEYIEGRGVVYHGKKNALNNFCTGIAGSEMSCNRCHAGYGYSDKNFDFTNPENIDCLVCHDNSLTYEKAKGKAGYPIDGIDYQQVFARLSTPKKANCGTCHFNSAGGNNVKHGDLENAILVSGKDVDVHMGNDGLNMECTDCHQTKEHVMKGRYYGLSSTNQRRALCEDCHTAYPHKDGLLNEHTLKVSCKTCHIPTYAKVNPTKMSWDWSTATTKLDEKGQGVTIYDSSGVMIYLTDKGSFTWEKHATPEYRFFNGTADHHFLTDTIRQVPVQINRLNGSYADPQSKIIPLKIHRGSQPFDSVYNTIVQAKLWDPEKGKGALWVDYDWDAALKAGMEYLELPFSGKYGFVRTEMYLPISHMVSDADSALSCKDCHIPETGRLAGLGGFYMPGRDHHAGADGFGRFVILVSLLGVLSHASFRILSRKRRIAAAAH